MIRFWESCSWEYLKAGPVKSQHWKSGRRDKDLKAESTFRIEGEKETWSRNGGYGSLEGEVFRPHTGTEKNLH